GSPSGRPADKPAEGDLSPEAGQANLYPESQWQATTAGYTDPDRPHCPTCHADGHGADMGERLPSPVLWLPAGTQCASCCPHREDTASGWRWHEGTLDHRR